MATATLAAAEVAYVVSRSSNYAAARLGSGTLILQSNLLAVGQAYSTIYEVVESLLRFDASRTVRLGIVTAATLVLPDFEVQCDEGLGDLVVGVASNPAGWPFTTNSFVPGNALPTSAYQVVIPSSNFMQNNGNQRVTLSIPVDPTVVSRGGNTILYLYTARMRDGVPPTSMEFARRTTLPTFTQVSLVVEHNNDPVVVTECTGATNFTEHLSQLILKASVVPDNATLVLPDELWLALFTSAPDVYSRGTEPADAAYARLAVEPDTPVAGVFANTETLDFGVATEPWTGVGWWGLFDAADNLLLFGTLSSTFNVAPSEYISFPPTAFRCTIRGYVAGTVQTIARIVFERRTPDVTEYYPDAGNDPRWFSVALYDVSRNEIVGGGYTRMPVSFGAPSGAPEVECASLQSVEFPMATSSWPAVHYAGLIDESGALRYMTRIDLPTALVAGERILFDVGALKVRVE